MLVNRNGSGHQHQEMVAYLREGRVEAACAALRHEIQTAAAYIAEHLNFAGDPRSAPYLERIRRLDGSDRPKR